MISSMTGYGRAAHSSGAWSCEVEIRSVNHRFLDLATTLRGLPRAMEGMVTEMVRRSLRRGRVEVTVLAARGGAAPGGFELDARFVRRLVDEARGFAGELGIAPELTLGEMLAIPGVVVSSDAGWRDSGPAPPSDLVQQALNMALGVLVENRRREGARLKGALVAELGELEAVTERLDSRRLAQRAWVFDHYQERISNWLAEAQAELGQLQPSPERVAQEAAVAAERSDIEEEIVRLRSHAVALREALDSGHSDEELERSRDKRSPAVGKRLDFLIQEVARELNTIAAKGRDAELAHLVVEGRACCERLKEQVQNVE
jgi:uncharacterized protein (TIGR00255 family)